MGVPWAGSGLPGGCWAAGYGAVEYNVASCFKSPCLSRWLELGLLSLRWVLGDFDRGEDRVFVGCSIAELSVTVVAPRPDLSVSV